MTGGNWTVGVDGFAGELQGMRDSVECHGIWLHKCEREGKRRGVGEMEARGNLVEEGGEDGGGEGGRGRGRGEW